MELKTDPKRENIEGTDIYVRAETSSGEWKSVDVVQLDKQSLLTWLKSRGGNNEFAEEVVCILLGHRE